MPPQKPRYLIIAGSREYCPTLEEIDAALIGFFKPTHIVSGGCNRGVDPVGVEWSIKRLCKSPKVFLADWRAYSKSAGPRRNAQMADFADAALIFWDGKSAGSRNMIQQMKDRKKKYKVVMV